MLKTAPLELRVLALKIFSLKITVSSRKIFFFFLLFFKKSFIDGSLAESGRLFKKSGVCQTLPDFFFSPDFSPDFFLVYHLCKIWKKKKKKKRRFLLLGKIMTIY